MYIYKPKRNTQESPIIQHKWCKVIGRFKVSGLYNQKVSRLNGKASRSPCVVVRYTGTKDEVKFQFQNGKLNISEMMVSGEKLIFLFCCRKNNNQRTKSLEL